ncbi:MAG: nucleotidyltransferase family protein [Opitutales bacterium]|nr:nucleotidyltransferase family protein [Opitutales bacterium]
MKCLILAAGYATRLYPLTENMPKPLLEVKGKTILDWLVDDVDKSGEIGEYIVISNRKFCENFKAWAAGKKQRIKILDDGTTSNETRLGAVKDILFAIEELALDGDLLVMAGDNLLDFSLKVFIEYAKKKSASCVMRYFEPSQKKLLKCGVLTVDESDRVLEMTEKSPTPATNWCCPPFYFYKREDVPLVSRAIDEGVNADAPGSFIAYLCKKRAVYAMQMPAARHDIGNLESYMQIQKTYGGASRV